MSDHPLVVALHAAIRRRSWPAIEKAADAIRDHKGVIWPQGDGSPAPAACDLLAEQILLAAIPAAIREGLDARRLAEFASDAAEHLRKMLSGEAKS